MGATIALGPSAIIIGLKKACVDVRQLRITIRPIVTNGQEGSFWNLLTQQDRAHCVICSEAFDLGDERCGVGLLFSGYLSNLVHK
ncbi:MAG: hypothetical protein ABJ263_18490 [Tateyamaria sp.]|uniref:hypothetical protein n=1 Tax=Tateyamaria sp. TaxID=1929288 RepID=UPI0032684851